MNIKLTIAYDGTAYSGWQIQKNAVTVQELIQKAVRQMTGEENNLVGSGRTDAGVHALGQVASFRTSKTIPLDGFLKGLNSTLPKDIRILDIEKVSDDFHPIRDSKRKHYRYLFSEAEYEDPLCLNRVWAVGRKIDIVSMNEAASYLVGEHDFTSFRASDCGGESAVKEIYEVEIGTPPHLTSPQRGEGLLPPPLPLGERAGPPATQARLRARRAGVRGSPSVCQIDIIGSGFLKRMVRNIVGTLVDVGIGKLSPADFKSILDARDRKKAGVCAPGCGLYLVGVEY